MVIIIRIIYKHTCYTVEYCIISRNMIIYIYLYWVIFYVLYIISYYHTYIYNTTLHCTMIFNLTWYWTASHQMIWYYKQLYRYVALYYIIQNYKPHTISLIKKTVVIWYIYTYHISYIKNQKSYNTIYTHHVYIYIYISYSHSYH